MLKRLYRFAGDYLKDAVYAANDGIVTTFAVVAGVAGAALSPVIVLVLGFANLLADGFSMASGNYLGSKSEADQYEKERARSVKEFTENPEKARQATVTMLRSRGYEGEELETMATLVTKNKKFFSDILLYDRFGTAPGSTAEAIRAAIVTFIAFVVAGLVPLLPYVFVLGSDVSNLFVWASVFTAAALFLIGSLRTSYSDKSWYAGGLEMLLAGGAAAVIAYIIGALLRSLVGTL